MTQAPRRRDARGLQPVELTPVPEPGTAAAPPPPARRYVLRALLLPALLLSLLPVVGFGLLFLWEVTSSVSTDNATVSGMVAQLGPPFAGQLRELTADVGDDVSRDRVLATVLGTSGQMFRIRAPFDGVIVARYANLGDALVAGKPILAVLNPDELWVEAQVDETQINRVRPGQTAEVTVDALGQTVIGRVVAVGSASVSSVGQQFAARDPAAGRARQFFPVRVAIDHSSLGLVYGGLAVVKIHVR